MPNVADITDADLDRMHAETLAERGEAPPELPGEQLTTENNADDSRLDWRPKGAWGWRGSNPASLGSDSDGRTLLTLTLQTSRPPLHGELRNIANDIDNRARSDALSRLQAAPEWASYLEGKSEITSLKARLDALEKEGRDLEAERLKLAARPKGAGGRLVKIQERQSQIGSDKRAAEMEYEALQPIVETAYRKAQELATSISLEVIRTIREEEQQKLDAALVEFYKRHADELTDIAARLTAKNSRAHDVWGASLRSFIIAQLKTATPLPEVPTDA